MKISLLTAALVGLAVLTDCSVSRSLSNRTPLAVPPPKSAQAIKPASDRSTREPTFEETKDFLLRHTRKVWEENPGERHTYTLAFTRKRLKLTHTFRSLYAPGYQEKVEVELSHLDPTQVGRTEQPFPYLSLAVTNGERKISVETIPSNSIDRQRSRSAERLIAVPGSDSAEESTRLDARLKAAWTHLIRLAGGKPGRTEPF